MDVLHICISCRYHAEQRFLDGKRGGLVLFQALESKIQNSTLNLELRPAECLSACRNYCTLAFTGPHKMSMVFGRLDVASAIEPTCEALITYAKSYCDKPDGFVLRIDRPLLLQDKLIARVPPPEASLQSPK